MRNTKVSALLVFMFLISMTMPVIGSDLNQGKYTDGPWKDDHASFLRGFTYNGDLLNENYRTQRSVPAQQQVMFSDDIVELIEQIDESTTLSYIEDLVAFGPRVTGSQACQNAADYIYDTFAGMGLEVRYHHWSYGGESGDNVEGTLPGKDPLSDEIYIVCGHYDSVNGAPGADDNASGTAAVMACAEIMSQYAFDHTVRFVAFCGEEQGLLGSHVYAQEASQNGDNIVAVLNADMISYAENDYDRSRVLLHHDDASYWIVDFTDNVASEYYDFINLDVIPSGFSWGSDHYSFWEYDYNAVFYFENNFNPYYHSPNDIIANIDPLYEKRNCRLVLATLAELSDLAPMPDIKANGSDSQITISSSETLSVTAALNASGVTSNADWWVECMTPFGWYHTNIQKNWLPGLSVTHQGPLFDLSAQEVLNISHLPAGSYTFYFGIDLLMNGVIDMDQAYYDRVRVTVVP